MRKIRVIPVLLLKGSGLVKTRKFSKPGYLGDPINIVKIFNEKEVDELVLLDIAATPEKREPNFALIEQIASECFAPLGYGGGVRNIEHIRRLLSLGIEKVVVNNYAAENPAFIREAADLVGSQSIVVSMDVRRNLLGHYEVRTCGGTRGTGFNPVQYAREMEKHGAGEIMVNSIDLDGAMTGYDIDLIGKVSAAVGVPVIACGGAGGLDDLRAAAVQGGASAVAAGSMFVYQGKHRAVLISYPPYEALEELLGDR